MKRILALTILLAGLLLGCARSTPPGTEEISEPYMPPVRGTPGTRTVTNFLRTALMPVGTTLYVYGGGWSRQDDGASPQAVSVGLPEEWVAFFRAQDADYSYENYSPRGGVNEYYYAGADCSGYLGWTLNNTLYDREGEYGLVMSSDEVASYLAARGWGSTGGTSVRAGDVMSMEGHVWIAVGSCADGSVVIVHSTPSLSLSGGAGGGVQLSAVGESTACEAYRLAQLYMTQYYPQWSARYPVVCKSPNTYLSGVLFSWDTASEGGLRDPDGLRALDAAAVLERLFRETSSGT